MSEIFITGVAVLAGLCLYAAIHHLWLGWRGPPQMVHLLFGVLCLVAAGYVLAKLGTYRAESAQALVEMRRMVVSLAAIFLGIFPWFVAVYAGEIRRASLLALSALSVFLLAANLVLPYGIFFAELPELHRITLPWGETVTDLRARQPNPWFYTALVFFLLSFLYAAHACVRQYRHGDRRRARSLGLALAVFFAFALGNQAVNFGNLKFVHTAEFGFVAMVLLMNWSLSQELRRDAERLKASEHRFRSLVDQSPFSIQMLAPDGRTLLVNRAWEELWGIQGSALANYNILDDRQLGDKGMLPYIKRGFAGEALELPPVIYNPQDNPALPAAPFRDRWVRAYIYPIKDDGQRVREVILMHEDITERKQAEERIRQIAYHDYLTGLANRASLHEYLSSLLGRSRQSGRHSAMLLIDLDHFKTINDALSHQIGDLVLREVAQRLTRSAGSDTYVARLGGDEFVLLMPEVSDVEAIAEAQARRLAEEVVASLEKPVVTGDQILKVDASIGVTLFPQGSADEHDILRHADIALYRAKSQGRGSIQFFLSDMQEKVSERLDVEKSLRHALVHDGLLLLLQPQLGRDGRTVGAEALLRCRRSDGSLLMPDSFIPVAEESGLIHPIGQWALARACACIKYWEGSPATNGLRLSINVSSWQFVRDDFVAQIEDCLARSGAAAAQLTIEITESALFYDIEDAIRKMHALKSLGLRLALDDFGTGYSSLSYLKRLPLDELKIDRSFIQALNAQAPDVFIEPIIAIGHALGMRIIAEGVETDAQRAALTAMGCDGFQGYLWSPPLPEHDFIGRLSPRAAGSPAPATG